MVASTDVPRSRIRVKKSVCSPSAIDAVAVVADVADVRRTASDRACDRGRRARRAFSGVSFYARAGASFDISGRLAVPLLGCCATFRAGDFSSVVGTRRTRQLFFAKVSALNLRGIGQ